VLLDSRGQGDSMSDSGQSYEPAGAPADGPDGGPGGGDLDDEIPF
jgi:hypothetical protein